MENLITNAKNFLATDQGKKIEAQVEKSTGINVDKYLGSSQQNQPTGDPQLDSSNQPSYDIQGNAGQPGQYGQEGQYGAVRGSGFGGGLAKGPDGQPLRGNGGEERRASAYEGFQQDDSTASGGYGRNAQGGAFSRQNQMAADNINTGNGYSGDDDDSPAGYKTGTSTPGYRQEGDVDAEAAENRMKNQNMNVYGQQADDRGSKGGPYNEADEPAI